MFWLCAVLFAGQFETVFHDGLVALNQNNLQAAQTRLESASKLEPRDPRVWLALAQTYRKLNQADLAAAAAKNAESFASDAPLFKGLSIYYSEAGEPAKAAEMLQRAIRRNAYDEGSYFDLAQVYLKQQDFAGALTALDAGRKIFDKSAQLELAAGVAYYGLRRFPDAIGAFLRTVAIDSSIEQPYVFLGRMLDQAEGSLPRIHEVFAAFAQRAPDSYLSAFLYGKLLSLEGAKEAESCLRKSIQLNAEFWESHFELGTLLDRRGAFAEAAREIRRSTELNPYDAAAHYRLARLYDRLGKPAEAAAERELHSRLTTSASGMPGIK